MPPFSADSDTPVTLTPAAFHILLVLAAGERHGYAIMREAEALGFRMGPGTLYGSIKRLLDAQAIEECRSGDTDDLDERRRYYRITPRGLRSARAEATRLAGLVEHASARGLLRPEPGGATL